MAKTKRRFGNIKQLPSGKWRAQYDDPEKRRKVIGGSHDAEVCPRREGKECSGCKTQAVRHAAPHTFITSDDAVVWLKKEERLISEGTWTPPAERIAELKAKREREALTFGKYAGTWLRKRRNSRGQPLAPSTRDKYESTLNNHILPRFAERTLPAITRAEVRTWYASLDQVGPAARADAYNLLRSIMKSAAEDDELIPANPVYVRGAGMKQAEHQVVIATLEEIEIILANMRPDHRLMVQLGLWTTLRFGEITELRRQDVEIGKDDDGNPYGWLHVRRGVTYARAEDAPDGRKTKAYVRGPKTRAGKRPVAVPAALLPEIRAHLLEHTQPGADGLLFHGERGGHLTDRTFGGREAVLDEDGKIVKKGFGWYEARRVAGRSDLFFHDLRHTGASMAGQAGASLAELMARLGHSTPSMALHYQHSSRARDQEIARRLSKMGGGAS